MRRALTIETDWSAQVLADRARTEPNPRLRQRILAIRLIVLGKTVSQAAQMIALKQRQLRNWVHRFNREGLEGLRDRPRPGQPKHLPADKEQAFRERVRQAARAGGKGILLRGKDIRGILQQEFGARYSLAGTYFVLHRLGFSCLSPRPMHPKKDPGAQEDFKKTR